MRKRGSLILSGFLLILLTLALVIVSGCSGGEPVTDTANDQISAELTAAKAEVAELTAGKSALSAQISELETSLENSSKLNRELTAISAYGVWFDNYYGSGIYNFADFNAQLGALVVATGDANSIAAFNVYYEADQAYEQTLTSLPQDNSAWTMEQYETWRDSGKTRTDALGQIGGHLFNVLKTITWFEVN